MQSYPIPIALTGRQPVIFSGAFPLSEVEWSQFKAVLDAMNRCWSGLPPLSGRLLSSRRTSLALTESQRAHFALDVCDEEVADEVAR